MAIAIYGAGGCALDLAPLVCEATGIEPLIVSDHGPQTLDDVPLSYSVLVAVAHPATRRKMVAKVEARGLRFASVFPPSCIRRGPSDIGEGAMFHDYTMVTANARIGRHCLVNLYSYIAHDCIVGDFVTLSPRVCINGNVIVEDEVFFGTGAIIANGTPHKPLRIGKGAFIGMGALVTKDVPAGKRVYPDRRQASSTLMRFHVPEPARSVVTQPVPEKPAAVRL